MFNNITPIIPDDIDALTKLLQNAFLPVAQQYQLTEQKAPTNCAYMQPKDIENLLKSGASIFKIEQNHQIIATLTIRKRVDGLYELCRLAVLPEYQRSGLGQRLIQFGEDILKAQKIDQVTLFSLKKNLFLQKWYQGMGFQKILERQSVMGDYEIIQMSKVLS